MQDCGPIFGNYDIYIGDNCNEDESCYIENDGNGEYECHSEYKSSLFVNTAERLSFRNYFYVLDYEVFDINYDDKYTIEHLCKYPDIIWEYNETKDISEKSLKQFDDDTELLNELDAIHCEDSVIRLKISQYYFKNSSEFLVDTQIVNQQYDNNLRKWLGNDYKWKLLYRASEHKYTSKSFHKYCDDKGPTLVIIKSSGGWIFGGYTNRSWSGSIYYDKMIYDNQ